MVNINKDKDKENIMIRLFGVDIPDKKSIYISLTYIYGIGLYTSKRILKQANINNSKITYYLTDEEVVRLRKEINKNFKIEGDLKQDIYINIKRLIDINCYRGIRHKQKLPVRGQRTHSNARSSRKNNFYK